MQNVWPQCFIKNQPSKQIEQRKEKRKKGTTFETQNENETAKTNRKGVIGRLLCHHQSEKMEIESPFPKEVESFNNTDSFPDLEFVVPGMGEPLQLHKKILAKASTRIKEILKNNKGKRLDWMFEVKNEMDKQALMKTLRFCYGETLSVGTRDGECCALIAAFSRLQVTCADEVIGKLKAFALEQARNDLEMGIELLKKCTCYGECCDGRTCTLNKELAKIVLTKDNMNEHFRDVVIDCLMELPPEYLEEVEFGEAYIQCSEFCLKAMYVRYHPDEMTKEEKERMLGNCDWSKLSVNELRQLRLVDTANKDRVLMAYDKVLECCENEKERMKRRAEEAENEVNRLKQLVSTTTKERDELKERVEESEKTIEDMVTRNRLE